MPPRSTKKSPRVSKSPRKSQKTKNNSTRRSQRMSKSAKRGGKLKLEKIVKSPIKTKKLRAYFSDGTHTDFGAANYTDFILSGGEINRKKNYLRRHSRRENWKSPKTAGALSRWILWNKPTLKSSISDYKKRFNL